MTDTRTTADLPHAVAHPGRRVSAMWVIPVLAVVLAGWLVAQAWWARGTIIHVHFEQGHGLAEGDAVRYRGIVIGTVRRIELDEDLGGVDVSIGLRGRADELARAGSRFWIVRPQLGLGGVEGLDTILGGRYVTVLPGDGRALRTFVGLDASPVVERVNPDDLLLVLESAERGGLARGTPVMYREVRVGVVLSVELAGDGSAVEARVHIDEPYTNLVRDNTEFWDSGWIDADFGIRGVRIDVGSLESVMVGGVSLATPAKPGDPVSDGHRFVLHKKPLDEWLDWKPAMRVGFGGGDGLTRPTPARARLTWEKGFFKRDQAVSAWVLPVEGGVIGPRDVFEPVNPSDGSVRFTIDGEARSLGDQPLASRGESIVLASIDAREDAELWPGRRIRQGDQPEDCLIVLEAGAQPRLLAAARLTGEQDVWRIDRSLEISESWHGAPVVSRGDGAVIGVLIVEGDDVSERWVSLLRDTSE